MGKIVKIDHRNAKIFKPKMEFEIGFYIGIFIQFLGLIATIIAAIGFYNGLSYSKVNFLLSIGVFLLIFPIIFIIISISYFTVIQEPTGLFKISVRRGKMKSFIEVIKYVKKKSKSSG